MSQSNTEYLTQDDSDQLEELALAVLQDGEDLRTEIQIVNKLPRYAGTIIWPMTAYPFGDGHYIVKGHPGVVFFGSKPPAQSRELVPVFTAQEFLALMTEDMNPGEVQDFVDKTAGQLAQLLPDDHRLKLMAELAGATFE